MTDLHDDEHEVIHDPQTYPVSTDISANAARLAALGHPGDNLAVPTRTRTRTRGSQPFATPIAPYARPDDRSELARLRSVCDGLLERVHRLEAAMQFVLQQRYPNGIPVNNESETRA